ncbi:MAG: glycosyltransferase family 2 protein [Clostridiales bacterium]|nr:glycosyltransferase family 2 protein [Clostridiales bacterium]
MADTNTPFFSVVIPVYNSEKYLDECIRSIFKQTCKDFELVLVDDESKDSSGKICDSWRDNYPDQVTVIHQKNTGVYMAKRNGIRSARGRYIYVMDNDDLIISEKAFENLKDTINEKGADLVVFNAVDNMETGHLLCHFPYEDGETFEGSKLLTLYKDYLGTKNLHHIWMMTFSRALFDEEYEYREDFRMLRDGPMLILPILSRAKKVIYLKESYYYWRIQNMSSASKRYDVLNFFNSIRCLHARIIEYSKTWAYKDETLEELIHSNYMMDVSITAIKVRSINPACGYSRRGFLKMLSNDEMFRKEYSLKHLQLMRKIVVFALYHRMIGVVNLVSSVVGVMKKR